MYLITIIKVFSITLLILCYFLTSGFLWVIFRKKIFILKLVLIKIINYHCKVILQVLNVQVNIIDKSNFENKQTPFFYVSNHLSYLDIIILFAYFPSCFITSREVRETPLLGLITALAGCIFVERRNKSKIEDEINEIKVALANRLSVFIFPEATSTSGEAVKSFKRPLFKAAIETNSAIFPLTINYTKINNQPINRKNRDWVCWYGDMTFLNHFLNLISLKSITVNIIISNTISPLVHDKTSLALQAHTVVEREFIPFQ